jgi:hypothetical protein
MEATRFEYLIVGYMSDEPECKVQWFVDNLPHPAPIFYASDPGKLIIHNTTESWMAVLTPQNAGCIGLNRRAKR